MKIFTYLKEGWEYADVERKISGMITILKMDEYIYNRNVRWTLFLGGDSYVKFCEKDNNMCVLW